MAELPQRLRSAIEEDMKAALRSKAQQKLDVLRLMWAAIRQREIDDRITLDDAQILAVLDKMIKQRRESIKQYESAGRMELAAKESYEIDVIQSYLPKPLSETEVLAMIKEAIAHTGAVSVKDMGKVMGLLKSKLQGRADMGKVSELIKQALSG